MRPSRQRRPRSLNLNTQAIQFRPNAGQVRKNMKRILIIAGLALALVIPANANDLKAPVLGDSMKSEIVRPLTLQETTFPGLDLSLSWSLNHKDRGSYTILYTPLGNSAQVGPLTLTGGVIGGTNNITGGAIGGLGGAFEYRMESGVLVAFVRLGGWLVTEKDHATNGHIKFQAGLAFKQ